MGERGRVHDDAGHECGCQRPVAAIERNAESRGEERRHLAGGGGVGIDPVGGLAFVSVRRVVVEDDPRQPLEELGVPFPDSAHPIERAAVRDHEQVVVGVGVRIRAEPLDARQEAVQLRNRVGADRVGATAARLHDRGHREGGAERVRIGVLVPDGQHPSRASQPFDDGTRNHVEVRAEIDAHR